MQAFTLCSTCKTPIHRRHILREKDVRSAPTHLVVIFKCPTCRNNDRLVAPRDEWLDYVGTEDHEEDVIDQLVYGFSEDLRVLVQDFDDMANIWASYNSPPPIEVMRKCDCSTCKEKRTHVTR